MKKHFCLFMLCLTLLLGGCRSHKNNVMVVKVPVPVGEISIDDLVAPLEAQDTLILKSDAKAVIKEARKWLGTKYQYGGESLKGTDCSGMVMKVFQKTTGMKLPRNSAEQQKFAKPIDKKQLRAGDLVFFASKAGGQRVSHVGIYIGRDEFIHASSHGVVISSLKEVYYERHYHSSGRVLRQKD